MSDTTQASPMKAADGTPLKKSLTRALRRQKLRALALIAPLLQAAQALGFSGQWLTGWAAYDEGAARILHLSGAERVIGFIHLGTATHESPERHRPLPEDVLSRWQP